MLLINHKSLVTNFLIHNHKITCASILSTSLQRSSLLGFRHIDKCIHRRNSMRVPLCLCLVVLSGIFFSCRTFALIFFLRSSCSVRHVLPWLVLSTALIEVMILSSNNGPELVVGASLLMLRTHSLLHQILFSGNGACVLWDPIIIIIMCTSRLQQGSAIKSPQGDLVLQSLGEWLHVAYDTCFDGSLLDL